MGASGINKTVWTIGHSTHPIEKFLTILQSFNIQVLADIRSLPGSNKYPQFNQDALSKSLQRAGIMYIHMPGLGGRRRPKPDSENTGWHNKAFMGYADYMETDEFKKAIEQLEDIAEKKRLVYMCAEVLWWRCHRSLVSDYLKVKGWKVMHIMGEHKATEHPYTKPARAEQGKLFYD